MHTAIIFLGSMFPKSAEIGNINLFLNEGPENIQDTILICSGSSPSEIAATLNHQ